MNAAARTLPLVLLSALLLAAVPAAAQPGASWTESGDVTIMVRLTPGGSLVGREAAAVLESDIIEAIDVGNGGLIADQETGTLTIEGVGAVGSPRGLGDVFVLVGLLELNDAIVDSDFIRIGDATATDPSVGTLSVLLSDVTDEVTVRNGYLTCQASRMQQISVLNLGHAQVSDCLVEAISSTGSAEVSIAGSTLNASLPDFRGNTFVSGSTITSTGGTVVEGAITIGPSTYWDASATITVGQNTHTTDLIVNDSAIESGTAYVRGGGSTDLVLQGASLWSAIDLFHFQGSTVTADVNSSSQIESFGDLWIGQAQVTVRSGVATESRIYVAGDLGLGNFDVDTFTTGTLTIEDGGVVEVEGTLTIHPLAVLNLNGGELRVGALDEQGTLNRNGGMLFVPEPGAAAALVAGLVLAALRRARVSSSGPKSRAG